MNSRPTIDAPSLVGAQRTYFNSNVTKPVAFRLQQLRQLKTLLQTNERKISEAMRVDFGKSAFESFATEFVVLYDEIDRAVKSVARWSAKKRVGTNLLNWPSRSYIIPEPLGVALVIGAWNYPVQLSLTPAVAALAAGNTVLLKPSELTAATSGALAEMINRAFAPEYFHVVEGGPGETTALLEQKFDKIFFTGSSTVGKIVYQAAARNLTPVTLELGGKSPAIVAADCDLDVCVRRVVWAKFLNAGQTCIAPDYVVVHRSIEQAFLERVKKEVAASRFSVANGNYVQIIDERNTRRIVELLDPAKIVVGGEYDVAARYIAPTVVGGATFADRIMADEIFGPVLPVIAYDDLTLVLAEIKRRPKPLAMYVFSNDAATQGRVLEEISFGGGCVNDAVMHISNGQLPFGGVGESGLGSYHGEAGFRAFSHYKSVLERALWPELRLKYSPHTERRLKWLRRLTGCT